MKSFRRSAFTLAEMLVVIAIILILAALLIPAAFYALSIAKTAAIVTEMGQLNSAMQQYKVLNRSYPPNSNAAATAAEPVIVQHIQSFYGRATFGTGKTAPPYGMTPAEALVFWLEGYSSDPTDPLGGTRTALMQFDQTRKKPTRMVGAIQLYTYSPPDGQGQPYVYFHNSGYASLTYTAVAPGLGIARAYRSNTTNYPYINPESFQIISAGLDGNYGADADYPNYATQGRAFPIPTKGGSKDNVTNFSGGTLGSKSE